MSNPRFIVGKRGILATVINGGEVNKGDSISVLENIKYIEVPHQFSSRFEWVVQRIPYGNVLNYSRLLNIIGGSNAYLRTFPNLIKRYPNIPVHRIIDSHNNLIPYVENQGYLLRNEGVEIEDNKVKENYL